MFTEKIQFIVALIAEFAERYNLTDAQAEQYLQRYNAIELCEQHYEMMHTLSFADNVEGLAAYCRRNGGAL